MFYISLISCKVYGKGKEFDSTNIGMGEKDEFDDIIHTVRIGKSVPDSSFRRKHIKYIQGRHSIGWILSKQMYKFGNEGSLFDWCSCIFIKRKVVVNEKSEIEKNVVITSEESFQLFDYPYSQLNHKTITIWSLYSPITESLRRKANVMISRWKSFL